MAVEQSLASRWLIYFGAKDTEQVRMRLFCFYYAGATASIFRSWANVMPEAIELVAVQLPGREYRYAEPLLTNMREIVCDVVEALPLDKPFVVFGHSMGALIGFEVIRLLRAQGLRQPEMLIVAGRNAPQFKWRDAGMQLLPDDEFIAAVRDYDGVPEALLAAVSLRDLWLPRLRADLTISATYDYVEKDPLECPTVVMVGKEDALVTEAGLDGWRTQTTGGVRYFHYRGGHFFLHTAERLVLTKIVEELTDQLARQGIPQEDNDEVNKR